MTRRIAIGEPAPPAPAPTAPATGPTTGPATERRRPAGDRPGTGTPAGLADDARRSPRADLGGTVRRGGATYLPYVAALDGLRALAVLLVIGYHLGYGGLAGGYIGVEVFFVLSGWLVCALLAGEHRATGGIRLREFWVRRVRRLLPAMVVVVGDTLVAATLLQPDRLADLRSDAFAALGYHLNWRLILDHESYFAAANGPSALQHLWSLSIEEQFYLLFPLACGLLLARRSRGRVAAFVLVAAVASTVLRLAWYEPGADPSRIYFGADTRGSGLLLGVALGLLWVPGRLRPRADRRWARGLDAVALAGLAALVWYTTAISEQSSTAFGLPFTLAQVATLALIAVAVFPAPTLAGRALAATPLVWIGRRSYGIYLIHWPVIVFASRAPGQQPESSGRVAVQVAAILLLAAASYHWIEQPIRKRGFAGAAHDAHRAIQHRLADRAVPTLALGAGALALLAGASVVARQVVSATEPRQTQAESVVIGRLGTPAVAPAPSGTAEERPTDGRAAGTTPPASPPRRATPPAGPPPAPVFRPTTAVGDSVMAGGAQVLADRMGPALGLDAAVGRQMVEAPGILRGLVQRGQLGDVVVVHLGNNGPFTDGQIDALFEAVGPGRVVVLVTVFVPRRWEGEVNAALAAAVRRHPNARLADWRSVVTREPGLTAGDGYHLSRAGAQRYADVVTSALPG